MIAVFMFCDFIQCYPIIYPITKGNDVMSPKEWEKRKAELLEQLSLLEADVEHLRKSIPVIRQVVLETTADGEEEVDKKIDAVLRKLKIIEL